MSTNSQALVLFTLALLMACGGDPDAQHGELAPGTCIDDADCSQGVCVRGAHEAIGACASNGDGARCYEDADCTTGACIGESETSSGGCSSLQLIGYCDEASGCAAALICVIPDASAIGTCQDGSTDGICVRDEHCLGLARCVAVRAENGGTGSCSLAEVDSSCMTNADCNAPLLCIAPPTFYGFCSSGGLGESCRSDDFCQSGHCMILDTTFHIGECVSR